MAITESVGYEGTVGYDTYAQTVTQGARYTTESFADWRPVVVTGDRMVRVNAGVGYGHGIRDTATNTVLQHDIVTSGVRHDMVVCHRDWSTGVSEFRIIKGGSAELLPARDVGAGVADDQPIALVRIAQGSTVPVIVADLRCWAGDGGLVAVSEKALDYLGVAGTRVTIGDRTYTRVLTAAGAPYWDVNRTQVVQSGTRLVTWNTPRTSVEVAQPFPTPFASAPSVVPNIASSPSRAGGWEVRAKDITATGFTIHLFGPSSTWAPAVPVTWIATTA